jgi:hypothetical protein
MQNAALRCAPYEEENMKYRMLTVLVLFMGLLGLGSAWAQVEPAIPPPDPRPAAQTAPPVAYPNQGPDVQGPWSDLALPAGTLISVRTTQYLASNRNRQGDRFIAVLEQPLVSQGWVLARRGQTVEGRNAFIQDAGRVKGISQLGLELTQIIVVDGQQIPVRTQLIQSSGGSSVDRDAGTVGVTTGVGAMIGAAAGGGSGAAIGAAAGAAAGIAGILSTKGRPAELYPETELTFQLVEPAMVSTVQSRHAFQPVSAADYSAGVQMRNPARRYNYADSRNQGPAYYYYPPAWYDPYPYYGYGSYYGYGFGPRVYVSPRIGFYGSRRHR